MSTSPGELSSGKTKKNCETIAGPSRASFRQGMSVYISSAASVPTGLRCLGTSLLQAIGDLPRREELISRAMLSYGGAWGPGEAMNRNVLWIADSKAKIIAGRTASQAESAAITWNQGE